MQQMNRHQADHLPILCKEDVFEGSAIRFSKMATLQHLAAVRVASHLWTTKYIKDEASEMFEEDEEDDFKSSCLKLSHLLEDKVRKLPIPDHFIICLMDIVNRLGMEVFEWIKFHMNFFFPFMSWKCFHHIQWTARGRIDERETAKLIVAEDDVNDGLNYDFKAAASKFYFLYSNEVTISEVFYWNRIFFNKVTNESEVRIGEFDHYCFNKFISYSDDTVLRHCWATFDKERKTKLLEDFGSTRSDVMCFLLSQMDEEQQANCLRKDYEYVLLTLFTDWLWQDYFMPTLLHLFHEIDRNSFVILINKSSYVMKSGFQSRRCKALLLEMLQRTPYHLKLEISNECSGKINMFLQMALVSLYEHTDIIKQLLSIITFNKEKDILDKLIMAFIPLDNFKIQALGSKTYNNELSMIQISAGYLFINKEDLEEYFLAGDGFVKLFVNLVWHDFVTLEKLINIFTQNEANIVIFKQKFLEDPSFIRMITSSVFRNEYKHVDQVLTFCFSGDDQMVKHFKRTRLFAIDSGSLYDLIVNGKMPMSLEKFSCYCYGNKEGILVFRNELLQDTTRLASVCWRLFLCHALVLIDIFLDWCFSSDREKIKLFKKEVVLIHVKSKIDV